MSFAEQLESRRKSLDRSVKQLSGLLGIATQNLYRLLRGRYDMKASTLDGLADALDARWVLVPKSALPEVERLVQGRKIEADDIPSSIERLLGGQK